MKFPRQPTRQFLRFADTVLQLGCIEDEVGFEQLLAALGMHGASRTTDTPEPNTRRQGALTRRTALGTPSRNAGERLLQRTPDAFEPLSRIAGERGPSPQGLGG